MRKKDKDLIVRNVGNAHMRQAQMGTACAMAIVGNILLHMGLVTTGFVFIGFGLFMILYYVYKNAVSANEILPGVVYASR